MAMRKARRKRDKRAGLVEPLTGWLLHFPDVPCTQEFVQVSGTALGDDFLDLVLHDVFVTRQIVPCAENADGGWEAGAMLHVGEQKRIRGTRMMRVVNHEIALSNAIAKLHDFDVAIRFPANALVVVLAIHQRLAMLQLQDMLAARIPLGEREPRAVVENVAVLQNLHEGRPSMRRRML